MKATQNSLSEIERRTLFKWERVSKEAKKVTNMEEGFYEMIKALSELSMESK